MCIGYMHTLHCFIQGTWASADFNIFRGPGTKFLWPQVPIAYEDMYSSIYVYMCGMYIKRNRDRQTERHFLEWYCN